MEVKTLQPGQVTGLTGWVHVRRNHGKLIFIDFRTEGGILQVVFSPNAGDEVLERANTLRPEWVIKIDGEIVERPDNLKNTELPLGHLELKATALTIINTADTPPFEIDADGRDVNEELRLEYRYLDIRRERLHNNLKMRSKTMQFMRNYLIDREFTEVETPILTKSTPEGARDYVVPFRREPGRFYALPQSPQQYKQLLMVGGIRKYFQFARCMRDEDTRGDRQPEFTQLDIELAFSSQDEILDLIEGMFTELIKTHYPEKHITTTPWPRMSYADAMKQYQTDRPDLRKDSNDPNELAFCWVLDFPLFEEEKAGDHYAPSHHMFTSPKEEDLPKLDTAPHEVMSYQHDLALNGFEICGGSIRIHDPNIQEKIFDLIGFSEAQKQQFMHMLRAFRYGVPPHGGIAHGFDRLLMILQNEPNIREVMAFPKTGEGEDPLMSSPTTLSDEQLDELGITIRKKKK